MGENLQAGPSKDPSQWRTAGTKATICCVGASLRVETRRRTLAEKSFYRGPVKGKTSASPGAEGRVSKVGIGHLTVPGTPDTGRWEKKA